MLQGTGKYAMIEQNKEGEPMEKQNLQKGSSGIQTVGSVLKVIGSWIYRLRKVLMAIPVILAAIYLARYNMANLPAQVGIDLQTTGVYAQMISRDLAVLGPLAVTGGCLLLMFCSRRIFYPWIISVFTLVLPILLYLTNIYPN